MLKRFQRASIMSSSLSDKVLINTKSVLWFEKSRSNQIGQTLVMLMGERTTHALCVDIDTFATTLNIQAVKLTRFDLGERTEFSNDVLVVPENISHAFESKRYSQLQFIDGSILTVTSIAHLETPESV